jgi:hypothetical protein
MIHPNTELRFISPEVGYGVVAREFIPKGTITWVLDELDREFTPEQFNANLLLIDAAVSAGYREYADRYIATREIPGLGDATDSAIFYDGIHISNAGYALLAPVINREIQRLRRPRT